MKNILSLLLALLFLSRLSFSQDKHKVDSLLEALKTARQDTSKANILYELSKAHRGNNPDKALNYANQTLVLSQQIGFKKGIGNSYNALGMINSGKGDFLSAMEFLNKSLKIRKEISDDQGIAWCYNNIGEVYRIKGEFREALENYSLSLKIMQEISNKQGIAQTYNNMGIVYKLQGNYPEALKNYFASLKIREEIGDKQDIALHLSWKN